MLESSDERAGSDGLDQLVEEALQACKEERQPVIDYYESFFSSSLSVFFLFLLYHERDGLDIRLAAVVGHEHRRLNAIGLSSSLGVQYLPGQPTEYTLCRR
jgi:hypothetical protein